MELDVVTAGIPKKKEGRNDGCCREHYKENCGARTHLCSFDRTIYVPRICRGITCRCVSDDATPTELEYRRRKQIQNTKPCTMMPDSDFSETIRNNFGTPEAWPDKLRTKIGSD